MEDTQVLYQTVKLLQTLGWLILATNISLLIGQVVMWSKVGAVKASMEAIENSFSATLNNINTTNVNINKNLDRVTELLDTMKTAMITHDVKFDEFKGQYAVKRRET